MSWSVVVPVKGRADRKSRLTGLTQEERLTITERLLDHVLTSLASHPDVDRVMVLSPSPREGSEWLPDRGRGLNAELEAVGRALTDRDWAVVHADLPWLSEADVSALFATAETYGLAVAADRHGTGTNAVALKAGARFVFRFGSESCAKHSATLRDPAAVLRRPGFALDVDTPEDLAIARERAGETLSLGLKT